MVDIGKLNRRITFLRLETSEDEMGQDKSEWKKFQTVWATVKPYKSSEYNFMSKLKPEVTHRIYIRFRKDMEISMQKLPFQENLIRLLMKHRQREMIM